TQRFRNPNVSIQLILEHFLNHINYNVIYQLPHNNNAQILAAQSRNIRRVQRLTGKKLMKRNVEREALRLQINSRYIINLATDHIWNFSTPCQRNRFINLATNANHLNQNRVSRNLRIN